MPIKYKPLVFYGRTILSLALIVYLVTMLDWERIKYILPKLRLEFIWQAFFLVLFSILASAIRWSLLLREFDIRQRMMDSWRYYIVSMFYGIMLPGVIGGDVVRLGLSIKKHGANKKIILTGSMFFERACGFMIILIISAVTALFAPSLFGSGLPITNSVYALSLTTVICFIFLIGVLKIYPEKWFNSKKLKKGLVHDLYMLLGKFQNLSINTLFLILVLSFLASFLDILGSYFLAKALHIDLSFYIFLLVIPLVYILTALPISLGGLGVREGVLTFFLIKIGILASDAVILAFLIYLNRIAVALIGGFVQFMDKENLTGSV